MAKETYAQMMDRLRRDAQDPSKKDERRMQRTQRRLNVKEGIRGEGATNRQAFDAFLAGELSEAARGRFAATGESGQPQLDRHRDRLQAMGINPQFAPDDEKAYASLRGHYAPEDATIEEVQQQILTSLSNQGRRP